MIFIMNKLDDIKNKIDELNQISNLKDKIISMKEIKDEIDKEQKNSEKIMKKLNNFKSKEIEKYKKKSLTKLQKIFEETDDFDKKFDIYSQICFKIDKIEKELFGEIKNSDSEEIEFESDSDD